MRKFASTIALGLVALFGVSACTTDASVVNQNIANDADNFKILRRVVLVNGITDKYLMAVEGYCSLGVNDKKLDVTCKYKGGYKIHKWGLSDNVTWFAEQLDEANVSPNRYKFTLKPETLIPDVEIR